MDESELRAQARFDRRMERQAAEKSQLTAARSRIVDLEAALALGQANCDDAYADLQRALDAATEATAVQAARIQTLEDGITRIHEQMRAEIAQCVANGEQARRDYNVEDDEVADMLGWFAERLLAVLGATAAEYRCNDIPPSCRLYK